MSDQQQLLFEIGDEKEIKVVEPPKPEVKTKPIIPTSKKPKEAIKVMGDWTIHIATDTFNVSDFVDEIPNDGILLEEVRAGLVETFFQFTAARTTWDVDKENKRLFPDAIGGAKGNG